MNPARSKSVSKTYSTSACMKMKDMVPTTNNQGVNIVDPDLEDFHDGKLGILKTPL
jgi:hypothetical protein